MKEMTLLTCDSCGKKMQIPSCCGMSMMMKDDYMLCCCSEDCNHKPIPICCGQKMKITECHED